MFGIVNMSLGHFKMPLLNYECVSLFIVLIYLIIGQQILQLNF